LVDDLERVPIRLLLGLSLLHFITQFQHLVRFVFPAVLHVSLKDGALVHLVAEVLQLRLAGADPSFPDNF
jgi:hypothetical protein